MADQTDQRRLVEQHGHPALVEGEARPDDGNPEADARLDRKPVVQLDVDARLDRGVSHDGGAALAAIETEAARADPTGLGSATDGDDDAATSEDARADRHAHRRQPDPRAGLYVLGLVFAP